MKCKRYDTLIHLFLDGRLGGERERELKDHLAMCERCSKKLRFLEATEKKARTLESGEPPQAYWNTFSSRVMAGIEAGRRKKPSFNIRRMFAGLFSMPPARLRIAAGVVSVAVVVMAAILYINQRGGDIVPPRMAEQPERRPGTEILVERESGVPDQSAGPAGEPAGRDEPDIPAADAGVRGGEEASTDHGTAAKKAPPEEALPVGASEGKKEKQIGAAAPVTAGDAAGESAKSTLEPHTIAEDMAPAPVKDEERAEKYEERTFAIKETKDKAQTYSDGTRGRASGDVVSESLNMPPGDRFDLDGTIVPRIGEADTLLPESVLRTVIDRWISHIEENPSDSLARRGYEQVATCYYLLARLGVEDSIVAGGVMRIEQYIDHAGDPALKDILLDKLQKIHALRNR